MAEEMEPVGSQPSCDSCVCQICGTKWTSEKSMVVRTIDPALSATKSNMS